jgi:hypothetical protein
MRPNTGRHESPHDDQSRGLLPSPAGRQRDADPHRAVGAQPCAPKPTTALSTKRLSSPLAMRRAGRGGRTARPHHRQGVVLDVAGTTVEPPELAGTLITPGAIDPRWHVSACWFSGNTVPASLAVAEVIPERSVRMFAARDPGQKAAVLKMAFEARKLAKPDDPRLVAVATDETSEKLC